MEEKKLGMVEALPVLSWCFRVLEIIIPNKLKTRDTSQRDMVFCKTLTKKDKANKSCIKAMHISLATGLFIESDNCSFYMKPSE